MAAIGTEGLSVSIGGAAASGVLLGSVRVVRRLMEVSTGELTIRGAPADVTIPEARDAVEIRDVGADRVIFGGSVRRTRRTVIRGAALIEIRVSCTGHERRFRETALSPADGIRIAKLDTAAEQFEAVVDLLSGEGFSAATPLPDLGDAWGEDLRLQTADEVMRGIARAAGAVFVTSPAKAVSVHLTSALPDSGVTLDAGACAAAQLATDPKNYRTRQYVLSGDIAPLISFVGDGATTEFDLAGRSEAGTVTATAAPSYVGPRSGAGVQVPDGTDIIQWAAAADENVWGDDNVPVYADLTSLEQFAGNNPEFRILAFSDTGRFRLQTHVPPEGVFGRRDLTDEWESSPRAITITAPGLADLVIPGPQNDAATELMDATEPYAWRFPASFYNAMWDGDSLADWIDAIENLSADERSMMQVIFSDAATLAERAKLFIEGIRRLTVDGVLKSLGGENDDWQFEPATQILSTSGSAPPNNDVIRATTSAKRLTEAEEAATVPVDHVERSGIGDIDGALNRPGELLALHASPSERVAAQLTLDNRNHHDIAETVALQAAFASILGVENPDPADEWITATVSIRDEGKLIHYALQIQRDRFETETLEFWRLLRSQ